MIAAHDRCRLRNNQATFEHDRRTKRKWLARGGCRRRSLALARATLPRYARSLSARSQAKPARLSHCARFGGRNAPRSLHEARSAPRSRRLSPPLACRSAPLIATAVAALAGVAAGASGRRHAHRCAWRRPSLSRSPPCGRRRSLFLFWSWWWWWWRLLLFGMAAPHAQARRAARMARQPKKAIAAYAATFFIANRFASIHTPHEQISRLPCSNVFLVVSCTVPQYGQRIHTCRPFALVFTVLASHSVASRVIPSPPTYVYFSVFMRLVYHAETLLGYGNLTMGLDAES